ncbi:MAG: arsenite efflux transporter metallochaperone ArsD [Coriobacteriia bacterium]|nr:arsenite efflux transporter metallochaperone ArsD [Coriobacteriia bacterium]
MKKLQIFEPAMCCSTGLCGVSIDSELLRISTSLEALNKRGIKVDRFNLSSAPQEFIDNSIVNEFVNAEGADALPIVVLDDVIVIAGRYPSNDELADVFDLEADFFSASAVGAPEDVKPVEENEKKSCGCSSSSKCC